MNKKRVELNQKYINALDNAEKLTFHSDFCPYLELKKMLLNASVLSDENGELRKRFRILFTSYYRLNIGGLTEDFKNQFFAILFDQNKVIENGEHKFDTILKELYEIPRTNGSKALQFSFVSKLVAIHDENSPVYDRHVRSFFSEGAPPASEEMEKRISWYVEFLNRINADYTTWAQDERVVPILKRFKSRDSELEQCSVVRLMDFLVWKVGNQKLL